MDINLKIGTGISIGNNGIVFEVKDTNGNFTGKLRIGKAKIEWCQGRTRIGNGTKKTWEELISFFR